ncbi:MAG: M18 family aminopeptidase [Eubacteriales bacterium]|nr:M18 family aminopeptidase [Eubacteriales bacterium]
MDALELTKEMLAFIEESPTAFHAAANVERRLVEEGFLKLDYLEKEALAPGGKYYFMQNHSAILAVRIPKEGARGFRIAASHSDSPSFKVKETPEMKLEGRYVKLNTEKYGGMILNTWLDRPLSVAGRVIVKDRESGALTEKLVNIRKDLLVIPNVAIHFNREVNDGQKLNPQVDLLPLFAQDQEMTLKKLCAEQLGIAEEEILGSDLYVYNRDKGRIMGADGAFVGSPRLDDLQCAFATLKGFLQAGAEQYIAVYALFDNEEVGSSTKQGADSTILADLLDIVLDGISPAVNPLQKRALLQNSFLLSADNGHAVHPNHPEKSDPTNRPYLNGGVVLKFQGSQRYTTDGFSAAVVRDICKEHKIPVQNFANRADIAGGSTLGNISTAHVSIPSADIGLAQLAMHSAFETAGVQDTKAMAQLAKHFFA